MAIIRLPYGEGLERSKGVMVVRPTSFEDLRNVHLFDGKAQVRQGMAPISVLVDDGPTDLDVTVMLAPLRSEAAAMGVGYNTTGGVNREVWLNRMAIDGTGPSAVGLLGTLDGGATFVPPIIVGADSDNKFFVAHDEPNPTSRIVTQIYDPGGFPNLSNLTADLDGNGQADVFFRGVVRHLSYIFGWGYGSASDPVRGDVVRVSKSGDSSIFEDFGFFEAGQQGETVMVCRSAGTSLMVFKENETYEIFGYSPDTFGIRLSDSLFGAVSSRLAVSIAGTVFFWSTQGPRLTSGGPSDDIAVPLDIGGPDPSTLVAESEPQDAFAEYDPATRVVNFVWGQRVYALSIRDPNRPRWSYYELGETAQCGGLFFSTQSTAGGGGPPAGAPENLVFDEEARGTLTLTGNANNGETVLVNNKTYLWQTVLTNVDGNVFIGATPSDSLDNLIAAITLTGTPGVDYAAAMTDNDDMTAAPGPGDTMIASGKLGMGFESNGKPLQETMANGSWNTPVTKNGIGQSSTFVGIKFDNIGQIGAEDIEVHVSADGGATYSFSGIFPADGLFPEPQFINVTLENEGTGRAIQPLTDYKFSLRYRLGGLHSPGYTDPNPDLWDTPAFDSQGTTTTDAEEPVLTERVGGNQGIWDRLNTDDCEFRIPVVLPAGHEELDVEFFLEIQAIDDVPDNSVGASRGDPVAGGANALRAVWNVASPGYPNTFTDPYDKNDPTPEPQNFLLNLYKARFRKGANVGLFSNTLECMGGPDLPKDNGITSFSAVVSFLGTVLFVNWTNATTPPDARTCPATPPSDHRTQVFARNVTTGGTWVFQGYTDPFLTNHSKFTVGNVGPVTVGDTIRAAVRHEVTCFPSGFHDSEWSIEGAFRYAETVAVAN